jgi:DNA-directed RNA polymerase specialized sigma24 family protein
VTPEQLEDAQSQTSEGSSSGNKRVKYLRLLEPDLPTDDEIWREFEQDVHRECMKKPTLRPHADRWTQETLLAVWKNRPRLTSPWGFALGTLNRKISEAIRENQKARRSISTTENEDESSGRPDKKTIVEQHKELWHTDSPDAILESGIIAKFEHVYEERLKSCATSAVSELPRPQKELFSKYYGFETHDRENRETLVEEYKLKSYDNLQVRIHRIWPAVLRLVGECIKRGGVSLTDFMNDKHGRKLVKDYVKRDIRSKSSD